MMFCNGELFCQVCYISIIHAVFNELLLCGNLYLISLFTFAELDTKAQNLSILSQKYKKDATYLNTKSMYVKAAAGCIVVVVFLLYFWVL